MLAIFSGTFCPGWGAGPPPPGYVPVVGLFGNAQLRLSVTHSVASYTTLHYTTYIDICEVRLIRSEAVLAFIAHSFT